jgi:hypothetical protein
VQLWRVSEDSPLEIVRTGHQQTNLKQRSEKKMKKNASPNLCPQRRHCASTLHLVVSEPTALAIERHDDDLQREKEKMRRGDELWEEDQDTHLFKMRNIGESRETLAHGLAIGTL